MRFLERLTLSTNAVEYRLACKESDLAASAILFLDYLQKNSKPDEVILYASLELAATLEEVKGEDFRWFRRMAQKIKKHAQKTK